MEQRSLPSDQKDVGVPAVQQGQAEENVEEKGEGGDDEEGEEDEYAPIILVVEQRKSRRKTSKPDRKEKGIAESPEKPKKKSMPKINENATKEEKVPCRVYTGC